MLRPMHHVCTIYVLGPNTHDLDCVSCLPMYYTVAIVAVHFAEDLLLSFLLVVRPVCESIFGVACAALGSMYNIST